MGLLAVGVFASGCSKVAMDCFAGGSGYVTFATENRTGAPSLTGQHAAMIAIDGREFHFLCTAEPDAGVSCAPGFEFAENDFHAGATIDPHYVSFSFNYPDLRDQPKKIRAVVFAGAEPTGKTLGETEFEPDFDHDETSQGEVCEIAEAPDDTYPLTP